jgi:hypothetical protein
VPNQEAADLVRAKQVTRAIKACGSWQQLAPVLDQHAPHLSAVNLSAAVTHLAQLHPGHARRDAGLRTLALRLLEALAGQWAALGPRQLANITWALGKLGVRPTSRWLRALFVRLEANAPQLEPQHITSALLGLSCLAALGAPAPGAAAAEGRGAAAAQAQGQAHIPEQLLQRLCEAAVHRLSAFKASELSTLLYALARLGHTPGADSMALLLGAVYTRVASFKARELATLLWALGKMRHKPSQHWINCLLVAVEIKLKVGGWRRPLEEAAGGGG